MLSEDLDQTTSFVTLIAGPSAAAVDALCASATGAGDDVTVVVVRRDPTAPQRAMP